VDQIMKRETSVALADVLHLNVLERAQAAHGLHCCILPNSDTSLTNHRSTCYRR
jgi:hypothetical protein